MNEVRAELRRLQVEALGTAAQAYADLGRAGEAIAALEEVLRLEPFRETAYRRLMREHLRAGNRAEALRVYERARELLADQLGIDPAPETKRLYVEALRSTTPSTAGPPPVPTTPAAEIPEIRYACSGRINIAHQIVGDGPVDLVLVPGWVSNLELAWHEPRMAGFLGRLASSTRLIMFDKRGTGLSDPIPLEHPPSLEERMDDVRAVMDAAGSEQAVVLGFSEGGTMSILFAAAHPERVARLVLWCLVPHDTHRRFPIRVDEGGGSAPARAPTAGTRRGARTLVRPQPRR